MALGRPVNKDSVSDSSHFGQTQIRFNQSLHGWREREEAVSPASRRPPSSCSKVLEDPVISLLISSRKSRLAIGSRPNPR